MYLGGAPGYSKTRMVSVGASERALCPWLGGSIVGKLAFVHPFCSTKGVMILDLLLVSVCNNHI